MQGLDINGRFEIAEELLDARKSRPWHKRTVQEVLCLPFNPHLAKLPLLGVHQLNGLSDTSCHV
jgi:hypothetical protein